MRRYKKKEMLQTITFLIKTNDTIVKEIKKNTSGAIETLVSCQEAAILLGTYIETLDDEYAHLVKILEDYCENIYQISIGVSDEGLCRKLSKTIQKQLTQLSNEIQFKLPEDRKEIVFLPYKASMWDSLESIWKVADADPDIDVYVVPIPYYDKKIDGSFGEEHYEGDQYPEYVPITDYRDYNLEERLPDVIFFHNPYDGCNKVTSVPPFFFAKNLKKYTDQLIYVPYYVVPGAIPENFILTPGVLYADYVFVQSTAIRALYIKCLEREVYHGAHEMLAEKIVALGSPKTDKVLMAQDNRRKIPKEWEKKIENKKVVFFNTNVRLLLSNNEYFVENLYRIFHIFEDYKEDFILLWREHPLTMETLSSMKPELLEKYLKLKEEFEENNWGIIDKTYEPHLAMGISDCYFGAGGSLVTIYSVTAKPMMITAYNYPEELSENEITKEEFYDSLGGRTYYKEEHINALRVFLDNYEEIATFKEHRLEVISKRLANLDGTVGTKIYDYIMKGIK